MSLCFQHLTKFGWGSHWFYLFLLQIQCIFPLLVSFFSRSLRFLWNSPITTLSEDCELLLHLNVCIFICMHHYLNLVCLGPLKVFYLQIQFPMGPLLLNAIVSFSSIVGWKHIRGKQNCCHIVLLFMGPMFEFQPCHYYEGFSQCFCILW